MAPDSGAKLVIDSVSGRFTEKAGDALGSILEPGDVVWLSGELGSGKTTLVRGMACALGSEDEVASPTFAIMHVYAGRIALNHIDLYRIKDRDELADLDYDLLFNPKAVSVVEWASRFAGSLPRPAFAVNLMHTGPLSREIQFDAPANPSRLKTLETALSGRGTRGK